MMLPGPPELEERYRRFLDGRGDVVQPLIFLLGGDRRARAETGAWAALILSRVFFLKGNVNLSLSYLRLASSRVKYLHNETLRLGILVNRALILKARGRTPEAKNLLRVVVDRALEKRELFVAAKAASNHALCIARCGEAQEAASYVGLDERVYTPLGCKAGLIRLAMTRALLEAREGRYDAAIERVVGALKNCDEGRLDREAAVGTLLLAEFYLGRGDLGGARSAMDRVASMRETLGRFEAERYRLYRLESEFSRRVGRPEEAVRYVSMADGLRRRLGIAFTYPGTLDHGDGVAAPVARESVAAKAPPSPAVHCCARTAAEPKTSAGVRAFAGEFVTRDPSMMTLLDDVRRAAALSLPLLIQGESGTGKDLIAKMIHAWSGRGREPFVPVNVAALPVDLFESIAFGHARGAFTGAVYRRPGLIESAGRGTLFLDEIGELSLAAQAKLLRVIDSGEFIPLGEARPRSSEARIVAATNRDLGADCSAGRFRIDLYYRLAALMFTIPPLRERRDDIALIANHLLEKACARHGLGNLKLHGEAAELLSGCQWPGNVRELESEILKAALKAQNGCIRIRHLSPAVIMNGVRRAPHAGDDLRARARSTMRNEILDALSRFGGNRSRAAEAIGIKRTTLIGTMKRLGIDR
jgi:DNA-binding NtrC family response regulator/tetratricopeptide (TPR) repeat protein